MLLNHVLLSGEEHGGQNKKCSFAKVFQLGFTYLQQWQHWLKAIAIKCSSIIRIRLFFWLSHQPHFQSAHILIVPIIGIGSATELIINFPRLWGHSRWNHYKQSIYLLFAFWKIWWDRRHHNHMYPHYNILLISSNMTVFNNVAKHWLQCKPVTSIFIIVNQYTLLPCVRGLLK